MNDKPSGRIASRIFRSGDVQGTIKLGIRKADGSWEITHIWDDEKGCFVPIEQSQPKSEKVEDDENSYRSGDDGTAGID